jgi:hypothetical protein
VRHVARLYRYDRPFELRLQQVVQQVHKVFTA